MDRPVKVTFAKDLQKHQMTWNCILGGRVRIFYDNGFKFNGTRLALALSGFHDRVWMDV